MVLTADCISDPTVKADQAFCCRAVSYKIQPSEVSGSILWDEHTAATQEERELVFILRTFARSTWPLKIQFISVFGQ